MQQNTFVSNLIKTYQPTLTIGTDSCGYACSGPRIMERNKVT